MSLNIEWKNLTRVLNEYAEYFIQEVRDNIANYGAFATNNLRNNLKSFIEIGDDNFSIKIMIEDYWKYVEGGTKGTVTSPEGAKYKAHFPPVTVIKDWIEVKGLSKGNKQDDLSFAFAICNSIEKRGIKPKPFFTEAKEATYKAFEERINYAVMEDVKEYVEKVLIGYAKMFGGQ